MAEVSSHEQANTENAAHSGNQAQGTLEQLPASWLHHFIKSLPPVSKKALFATSRCFAQLVMVTSAEGTLALSHKKRLAAEQAEVRRGIITRLLSERKEFGVHIRPSARQPFPTQLSNRVVTLRVDYRGGLLAGCCQWAAMTNLRKASLSCENHVSRLCEAVEAGQLPHLLSLQLQYLDEHTYDEVVRVFSHQWKDLSTNSEALLTKCRQLTALLSVTVMRCTLSERIMQPLREHPTLRYVTLKGCGVEGDYSHCSCNWERLSVMVPYIGQLCRLPLAAVQQVCVHGGMYGDGQYSGPYRTLAQHAHNVVCQPPRGSKWPSFTIHSLSRNLVPLVGRMEGVQVLNLHGGMSDPDVVCLLWQVLPVLVHWVLFHNPGGMDWACLWQGLPKHVTKVSLDFCSIYSYICTTDLCTLVRTAPPHLTFMILKPQNRDQGTEWQVVNLYAMASEHLSLIISPCDAAK